MYYKTNLLDRLPTEIRYYIAEYIDCKDVKSLPYIPLFKNIILHWYNTSRIWDNSNTIYTEYEQLFTKGIISQEEIPFLKYAFKWHRVKSKYYNMKMIHSIGQFEEIACKCRIIPWNGMKHK
jgi:hypothetical protein